MSIRVLLVDDHAVFLETLAVALGTQSDIEIVGAAATATEGRECAEELKPDVALVDIGLPDYDGVELAKQLREITPGTRVVMLTGLVDASFFPRAMSAGAAGYLIKEAGLAQVTEAIRRAHAGQVVVPEDVVERLTSTAGPEGGAGSDLTQRELEVLTLMGRGNDPRSISEELSISWNTARSYVKAVLQKLEAHSQLDAVAKATRLGILRIQGGEEA